MDLKPIYEFRTRLYAVTMAGTQLIMEDYRFKRAVEELQPLEKASPVFARIVALGKQLISSDCTNKEGILLDCITLTDAVLCTQGVVTVSGELREVEDIVECNEENSVQNIPYSILHNLIESLTGSGSGRYAFVGSLHTTHPHYFEDYRVKTAMVEALSDSYVDLADMVESWIRESGESFVPFLKRGFYQKKPSATVKVVQLIEEFSKEKENEFYLEKLSESEKNVRGALIFALRHTKENTELLLQLARTEKGSTKKMAYWALAEMEGQEVEEFWNAFYKKKPKDTIEYLTCSKSNWSSAIVAKEFNRLIEPWIMEETPKVLANETIEEISKVTWALQGKTGAEVCECYRKVMQIGGHLKKYRKFQYNDTHYENGNKHIGTHIGATLSYRMIQVLHTTLLQCQDKQLGKLAIEFYETYGEPYFVVAVAAKLLDDDGTTIHWIVEQLEEQKISKQVFIEALGNIEWDKKEQSYVLKLIRYYNADARNWEVKTPIQASLDEESLISYIMNKFCTTFGKNPINYKMDCVMLQWIRSEHTDYCNKLQNYYYNKALNLENNRNYLYLLQKCYAKECKGIAVKYFKGMSISFWAIGEYFKDLPGTVENKAEEARAIYDLILNGDILLSHNESKEYIQKMKEYYIQEWSNS